MSNRAGDIDPSDLANRLNAVAIHLLRRVRREDAATALSPARLSALSVIGFAGSRTVGELAAAEQVSVPTMSRIVTALEQDGLVRREPDAHDGRVARLHATNQGMVILREGRARRAVQLDALLRQLTPEERHAVVQAVTALERLVGGPHE
jgi:DNA-binding MarR family transcriptional regulator